MGISIHMLGLKSWNFRSGFAGSHPISHEWVSQFTCWVWNRGISVVGLRDPILFPMNGYLNSHAGFETVEFPVVGLWDPILFPMNGYLNSHAGFETVEFPVVGLRDPILFPMNGYLNSHAGFETIEFPVVGLRDPILFPMNGYLNSHAGVSKSHFHKVVCHWFPLMACNPTMGLGCNSHCTRTIEVGICRNPCQPH